MVRLADSARAAENVTSPLLPGGSLIAASLDRQVMIWSDRGGASRHIGDRWAIRTTDALTAIPGTEWPVPLGRPFVVLRVLRLDDVPEVSIEANRHQLENPDFLLVGVRHGDHEQPVLQAVDAKFAADRIKPSQVSAEVVSNLLDIPDGVTRTIVDSALSELGLDDPLIVRGVFVCPESELTSYLMRRAVSRDSGVKEAEIVTIEPLPETLFVGLPMSRIIGPLARIDALPVTPRANLISAIYYFRLACASFFLWSEGQRPLLTNVAWPEPEPGLVAAEVARRTDGASSAWDLIETWAYDVEPQVHARQAIQNVASLPIRMRDVRALVEQAGRGEEPGFLRWVRKELELTFRRELLQLTGEIAADDPRPLPAILDAVARAGRELRPAMQRLLHDLVAAEMRGKDAR